MFMKPYDHGQNWRRIWRTKVKGRLCDLTCAFRQQWNIPQAGQEFKPFCFDQILFSWILQTQMSNRNVWAKRFKDQTEMCDVWRDAQTQYSFLCPQATSDCWGARQKGTRRTPVPSGEKGLTLAHMRASLREMADLPSSRRNTGPCMETQHTHVKSIPLINAKHYVAE